jgi:hypothetical protein
MNKKTLLAGIVICAANAPVSASQSTTVNLDMLTEADMSMSIHKTGENEKTISAYDTVLNNVDDIDEPENRPTIRHHRHQHVTSVQQTVATPSVLEDVNFSQV